MEPRDVVIIKGLRQQFSNPRRGEEFLVEVDDLRLPQGAFVAIQGPNGCGKTTLVTVLALLRRPSNLSDLASFEMHLPTPQNGVEHYDLKDMWRSWRGRHQINTLRRRSLGFAPQQLELLSALKVRETVAISLWLNGEARLPRRDRVRQLLDQFGLAQAKVTESRIRRVSGGQQQKVTLARAIAHSPPLIFLDEPTAYLHPKDAREALAVLRRLQRDTVDQFNVPTTTIVMITHDHDLANDFASLVIKMKVVDKESGRVGCIDEIIHRLPNEPATPSSQNAEPQLVNGSTATDSPSAGPRTLHTPAALTD